MFLRQLLLFVIKPTLAYLQLGGPSPERILLATIAQETKGDNIDQVLGSKDVVLGPAYGPYQIEGPSHDDLFNNFLRYRTDLLTKVQALRAPQPSAYEQLAGNFFYATAVARCIYFRDKAPLPQADDAEGMWKCYKRVWNTELGAATREQFMAAYTKLVIPAFQL